MVVNVPRLSTDRPTISTRTLQRKKQETNLSPPESPIVVDRAVDAPRDGAEPPKVSNDGERNKRKGDRLCAFREAAGREDEVVEHVCGHEDGKVERRELKVAAGKT